MRTFFKILLIGIITTVFRIIGQLAIPQGSQNVLLPSVFVSNGTMPIVFTAYGILAYSLIAILFLLIRNNMSGNKIMQGVKFGLSCCAIWAVYLLEPLPHAAPIDRITYPLADGAALLVMGLLLGILLGRMAQYMLFDIYSSFHIKTMETVLWCICTGFTIACSLTWLNQYVGIQNKFHRICRLGLLLFGLDLMLFNFFMPLVFNADILDLVLRTSIDIVFVSIGCLFFKTDCIRRECA